MTTSYYPDCILELVKAYNEPHRYYHNWNHISDMFYNAKIYNLNLTDTQQLAILFHDIIYNVKREDNIFMSTYYSNEQLSADIAYNYCKMYNEEIADNVKQIILDTEKELPTIKESEYVIDLDLLGLAFKDKYDKNGVNIKQEFKHLDSKTFYTNRLKWIMSMLDRDTIFVSEKFNHLNPNAYQILNDDLNETTRRITNEIF